MPRQFGITVAVVGSDGAGHILGPDGEVREVWREKPCNTRSSRTDCICVLRMCYITGQLETINVPGHGEIDMGSHVP
jgi:hypothetical protein